MASESFSSIPGQLREGIAHSRGSEHSSCSLDFLSRNLLQHFATWKRIEYKDNGIGLREARWLC